MTGVPTPRADGLAGPGGLDAAAWQMLQTLTRLESNLEAMRSDVVARFERLDERFPSRRESEQFQVTSQRDRDALHAEVSRLDAKHDGDMARLDERLAADEVARNSDRKWALGLVATILLAVSGEGLTLFTHYR